MNNKAMNEFGFRRIQYEELSRSRRVLPPRPNCHFCLKQRLEMKNKASVFDVNSHLNDRAIRFRNKSSNCIIELCDRWQKKTAEKSVNKLELVFWNQSVLLPFNTISLSLSNILNRSRFTLNEAGGMKHQTLQQMQFRLVDRKATLVM